jgi:fructose-1,6-bisphosphatase I
MQKRFKENYMNEIYKAIERSAIRIREAIEFDDMSYSENQNSTGDTQLKLDIKSDIIIEEEFANIKSVKELASEEKDDAITLHSDGKYLIGYDPLDGSSLADVNLSVGSIFGIYEDDYSGANLKAAIYVVYGPRVEMVIADESDDVRMYKLDANDKFLFSQNLKLNQKGKLNAPGGTQQNWLPYHKQLVDSLFADGYRLRYSGGMVPDLHQILIKGGGLFSYPGTSDKPEGKLRMTFEVFPFAFVYEKAGGASIDGKGRVLDLSPRHIHDTTPCFFGSNDEIKRVKEAYERG